MKNFLFIDDHSMVRAGLMTIVASEFPEADFFEAENERQAKAMIDRHRFSLIIMDINMPDSDSTRLLQYALRIQPETPVLILSMNDEKSFAIRYFKLGIKGFIHKSVGAREILNAMSALLEGGIYISESLKNSLLQSYVSPKITNPFETLSEREFQVIRGLLEGKNIALIAEELAISISTVSTYKGKACEKLGIPRSGFVELVSLARLHNMGV